MLSSLILIRVQGNMHYCEQHTFIKQETVVESAHSLWKVTLPSGSPQSRKVGNHIAESLFTGAISSASAGSHLSQMNKQGSRGSEGKDLRYLMPSLAYFSIFLQPFF